MTSIAFVTSNTGAPPFSALVTLDGQPYTIVAYWNAYRVDWYISLLDQAGNTVVNTPLIASPPGSDILIAPWLFTASTLVYRESSSSFEVTP